MPAIQHSEFYLALNQVATERGVPIEVVLHAIEEAILVAYRKDHPEAISEDYSVTLNPQTGEARVKKAGDDVTPPGFGRIAAQAAKQVILQKVREEEKAAVLNDFRLRIGTVMNGMVLRFAGPHIIVAVGKTEALMPVQEQIPAERYRLNQQIAVFIKEIITGSRGEELVVSRADSGLLEGLFRREVPEIAQGTVVIKKIARKPGVRAKVAVAATQGGIDPVGSCVGQKGVRVQAVIQEFQGIEKIDVIQWMDQPIDMITQALAPAKELKVTLDEATRTAYVLANASQLSSAIGKEGQNVILASELTGWNIDIKEDPQAVETPQETPEGVA